MKPGLRKIYRRLGRPEWCLKVFACHNKPYSTGKTGLPGSKIPRFRAFGVLPVVKNPCFRAKWIMPVVKIRPFRAFGVLPVVKY